jgi:hypothetical protein
VNAVIEKGYAMFTITPTYPNIIRVRRLLAIGLTAILILTSFVLIVAAILVVVLSITQDAYQADKIPVVQNLISPIPIPTPPTAGLLPVPSETPSPTIVEVSGPSLLPVPVPSPP